jgi:hypothetical protein
MCAFKAMAGAYLQDPYHYRDRSATGMGFAITQWLDAYIQWANDNAYNPISITKKGHQADPKDVFDFQYNQWAEALAHQFGSAT